MNDSVQQRKRPYLTVRTRLQPRIWHRKLHRQLDPCRSYSALNLLLTTKGSQTERASHFGADTTRALSPSLLRRHFGYPRQTSLNSFILSSRSTIFHDGPVVRIQYVLTPRLHRIVPIYIQQKTTRPDIDHPLEVDMLGVALTTMMS